MNYSQLTLIEGIFCIVLILCFAHEDKFIAFEQKVVKVIKELVSIVKAVRARKISFKDFYCICEFCILEEIEEHCPWCGEVEIKLVKEFLVNVIFIILVILFSIFVIQRWN